MVDDAVNSLRVQISELAHQYQQYRWFSFFKLNIFSRSSIGIIGSAGKEISPTFCPLLLKIRSVFASAGNLLSQVPIFINSFYLFRRL